MLSTLYRGISRKFVILIGISQAVYSLYNANNENTLTNVLDISSTTLLIEISVFSMYLVHCYPFIKDTFGYMLNKNEKFKCRRRIYNVRYFLIPIALEILVRLSVNIAMLDNYLSIVLLVTLLIADNILDKAYYEDIKSFNDNNKGVKNNL